MRAFQYSFQKVLDLKTNTKKQSEWMLAEALGQLQAAEISLEKFRKEREQMVLRCQEMVDQCASAVDLQSCQQYISFLDQKIEYAISAVKKEERNVMNQQKELEMKMIDEKVWIKAREKAEETYKNDVAVAEQYQMDEIATVRFHFAAR